MSGLGEQIAVLDGLAATDPNDGRIGQRRAGVTQYAEPKLPGVMYRTDVLDASEGANYAGGSSYAPGLPLMPSSVGLAGLGKGFLPRPGAMYFGQRGGLGKGFLPRRGEMYFGQRGGMGNIPNVLPTRRHVIDYSGGANYSGGSDWVPGLPLTPSSAGLADDFIRGGYGRAGLGAPFIGGGYGRAGLGSTGSAVDEDLAGAMEAVEAERQINPEDGRIGQQRGQVDEYGNAVMPGVLARSDVLDASEGANYAGGSSYAPGLPLMPSSVGLAGLDGLEMPMPANMKRKVGRKKMLALRKKASGLIMKLQRATNPRTQARLQMRLQGVMQQIGAMRQARHAVYAGMAGVGTTGPNFAMHRPLWAR